MDRDIKSVRFFKGYHLLKEVDDAAVIYISRWNTYGQFEIHLNRMLPCIEKNNRIMLDRDERKTGIIKYIKNDSEKVIIKGYSLLWLMTQRITVPDAGKDYLSYYAPIEDIMIDLVKKNAVECQNAKRNFLGLKTVNSKGRGEKIHFQTRYDNLMDVLGKLSMTSMLGISVRMDLSRKEDIFEVLEGRDKSVNQTVLPPVVFRRAYDNVLSEEYVLNDVGTKNCAYTAGQGEGADREICIVGNDNEGLERKEIYVDARDIKEAAELPNRGQIKLAECVLQEYFEAEVNSEWYKKRWDLGDIVTIIDDENHIILTHYISEIEESFDENGYNIVPTFGVPESTADKRNGEIRVEGPKGSDGAAGKDGSDGAPGAAGKDGADGKPGADGATYTPMVDASGNLSWTNDKGLNNPDSVNIKGPKGATGEKGATGAKGEAGEKGDKGDKGDQGDVGPAGAAGVKGDTGATGPKGDTGAKGATGQRGSRWSQGTAITGTSTTAAVFATGITDSLVNDMYLNTSTGYVYICTVAGNASTAKWAYVGSIKGAKGNTGATGATGAIGPKGEPGAKGDTGPIGPKGEQGATGPIGPKGDTGATGATGAKGSTGIRGSRISQGTAITGTSTTATVFSGTGITDALVNDMYLNTSTGNLYRCTTAGAASVAKWVYTGCIKGVKGDTGATGPKGDTGATGPAGTTSWNGILDKPETFPPENHNHNYLPLSGGTLTGNIKYNMGGTTRIPIEVFSGDANGQGVSIGAGGATIIGGGESKDQIKANAITSGASEVMMIGSDQNINFYTNLQNGWAARQEMTFDKSGVLTVPAVKSNLNGNADTATSAGKLATARNINGMLVDGQVNRVNYGTCSTAAGTVEKTVACTGFALITGSEITVKFTVTNTAANATLNVNGTGAKPIYYRGSAISAGYLAANRTYTFRYNGSQYELVGDINTNTTYSTATQSSNGLMSVDDKKKLDGIDIDSVVDCLYWKDGIANYTGKKTYSMPTPYVDKVYDICIKADLKTAGVFLTLYIPFERLSDSVQSFRNGYFINQTNGGMVAFNCSKASVTLTQAYLNTVDVANETTWNVSVRYRN